MSASCGRRTLKKLHGGQRTSYAYDDASNLTRVADIKSDSTTICSFDYQYDAANNRVAVLENDGSRVTWTYDDTYQLTGEHRTGSNGYRNTYTYDPAGNRTLKNETGVRTTSTYDVANQLDTSVDASGTTTYTYDADGNQRLVQAPSGDRTTTVWDYENRTTLIQLPSGIRNTMAYEPTGLRVKLEESTETKLFVWDDQRYLIEADGFGDTIAWYTVEPTQYGRIISKQQGYRRYFHFDGLGSTRVITQANENVNNRYTYDAWGNLIYSFGTNPNPFRFVGEQGYYTDIETDVIYVRARIYQPAIARWWSVDPLLYTLTRLYTSTRQRFDPVSKLYQFRIRNYIATLGRIHERDLLLRFLNDRWLDDHAGPVARVVKEIRDDPTRVTISERINPYSYVDNSPLSRVDPLGLASYANYCGPGGSGHPLDDLDWACKDHDDCYACAGLSGPWGVLQGSIAGRQCDRQLCIDAFNADCNTASIPQNCRTVRAAILTIFCTSGIFPF